MDNRLIIDCLVLFLYFFIIIAIGLPRRRSSGLGEMPPVPLGRGELAAHLGLSRQEGRIGIFLEAARTLRQSIEEASSPRPFAGIQRLGCVSGCRLAAIEIQQNIDQELVDLLAGGEEGGPQLSAAWFAP